MASNDGEYVGIILKTAAGALITWLAWASFMIVSIEARMATQTDLFIVQQSIDNRIDGLPPPDTRRLLDNIIDDIQKLESESHKH